MKPGVIYVFDHKTKAQLERKGFKFLHETQVDRKLAWVFVYDVKLVDYLQSYFQDKKDKYCISNKMSF